MRIDPAIEALRSDRAPQRQAQAAMVDAFRAWRADSWVERALAELQAFGEGTPLEECRELEALFTGQGGAERLAAELVRRFARTLGEAPFGHPPLRHGFDGDVSTLLLASSGRAQLLLKALEPGTYPDSAAGFSDVLRFDAVLAGEAEGVIARLPLPAGDRVEMHDERIRLGAGNRLAFDCSSETLLVTGVDKRLVLLRLDLAAKTPAPTREYDRSSGRLTHLSAGDLATSRQEMMLALLGRMKRREAVPLMAGLALDEGDRSLRWQALRECLALDTAAGFAALVQIARDADDPLCGAAGALRAQLVEAHPQLLEWEESQCPA
jgi:hypothetical protein